MAAVAAVPPPPAPAPSARIVPLIATTAPSPTFSPQSMPQTSRRGFLAALPFVAGFDIDKDNDGEIIDDLLGLDDPGPSEIGSFYIAQDGDAADRIDPVTYPAVVFVASGTDQGIYLFDEEVTG